MSTPTNTEADVLSEVLKEEGFKPADGGTPNAAENANGSQGNENNAGANGNGSAGADFFLNEDEGRSDANQGGNEQGAAKAEAGQGKPEKWTPTEADWTQFLTEKFGEGNADAISTKLKEREHFEQLTKATPYKSALGGQLDELLAKGVKPENAVRYLTIDPKSLSDKEIRAMAMGAERADLTADEISDLIDMNYGIGKFAKDDESEKQGLLRLKYDVGADRQKFDELKQKLVEPDNNQDRVKADFNNTKRIESWKGHTKKLIEDFKSIDIPVGQDKDGKPLKVASFKIKDRAVLEKLNKDIQTIIEKSPSLVADENGLAIVREIAQDRAFKYLLPQIAQSLVRSGMSNRDGFWSKELHNTQLGSQNGAHDFGGSGQSSDDRFVEAIVSAENGKRS